MSIKTKTIPALEARTQLGQIMKEVQGGRVRVLVEKSGVPMVGIISAEEIKNAPEALQKLDKNGDGQLTPDEYLGPRPQGRDGPPGQDGPPRDR